MARKSDNSALNAIASNLNADFMDNAFSKTVTFVAGTTGKQATGTFKLATVTGVVALQCFAVCGTDVAGATAKLEVGTALSTAGLIAQTLATDIDVGDIWHDATPDASIELTSVATKKIVTQDVNYLITVADITGGVVTFYFRWTPISSNGNVVVA